MASPTPTIGLKGRYSLKAPFQTEPGILYTCAALRRFVDLRNLGKDVYDTYYAPFDLDQSTYETDRKNNEVIVTLVSSETAPVYVPSSFIQSYPSLDNVPQQHVVLSVSLGLLPDTIDLTFAKQQVAAAVSDVTGVEPEVFVNVAPTDGDLTHEEAEAAAVARDEAVKKRTTDYARNLELENQVQTLTQRLTICEEILRQNDLIPN